MLIIRYSKILLVAAIAFFCSLVSFGNITDPSVNYFFVQHVLAMDTIFPGSSITYRAIHSHMFAILAYIIIIALETLSAILCWIGIFKMLSKAKSSALVFQNSKKMAVIGLTFGFLTWQVGFMSIGGELFGMWMSTQWNGVESAFRFFITILGVLIYVSLRDDEL